MHVVLRQTKQQVFAPMYVVYITPKTIKACRHPQKHCMCLLHHPWKSHAYVLPLTLSQHRAWKGHAYSFPLATSLMYKKNWTKTHPLQHALQHSCRANNLLPYEAPHASPAPSAV